MPGEREKVVISLGGSVLVPGEDDARYIRSLSQLLIKLSDEYKIFLVCGGGRIARYYIQTGRQLGLDERYLDELGIEATRLNARLVIGTLGGRSNPEPAMDYDQALEAASTYEIVVMGGVEVSITTDTVATELARRAGASRVVNATSVDGVYSADPKSDPRAQRLERLRHEELVKVAGLPVPKAGPTAVFDPLAARLAAKYRIPIMVVHGRDLAAVEGAIRDAPFRGTRIAD